MKYDATRSGIYRTAGSIYFGSLKLILSNIFIIHLLIELYILAFNAAVFQHFCVFHSECDQDAAATGRIAACSVRAVKPDAVAQEFHARRFLENDVLKHFGIATVEQQRDAVAVFRQLSDKLFDKEIGRASCRERV